MPPPPPAPGWGPALVAPGAASIRGAQRRRLRLSLSRAAPEASLSDQSRSAQGVEQQEADLNTSRLSL